MYHSFLTVVQLLLQYMGIALILMALVFLAPLIQARHRMLHEGQMIPRKRVLHATFCVLLICAFLVGLGIACILFKDPLAVYLYYLLR